MLWRCCLNGCENSLSTRTWWLKFRQQIFNEDICSVFNIYKHSPSFYPLDFLYFFHCMRSLVSQGLLHLPIPSHHIKRSLFYFLSSSFYGHWRLRGKRNIFPIINFVWLKKKGFRPNEAKQFDIILYMLLYCCMWSFYWAFNQFDMWNVSQTMLPFIIFHSRASSLVWSDIRYTA